MSWKTNPIMQWDDGSVGSPFIITDHNRSPLEISVERIEKKQRMVDGTLRRYVVAKKRTFNCSWEMLPHRNDAGGNSMTTVNGMDGRWMELFHDTTDGPFKLILRSGTAKNLAIPAYSSLPYNDVNFFICEVMIAEFSKDIQKRGAIDFWNINLTLEEV